MANLLNRPDKKTKDSTAAMVQSIRPSIKRLNLNNGNKSSTDLNFLARQVAGLMRQSEGSEQGVIVAGEQSHVTFPLFKEFPAEIRIKIWREAMSISRVVGLSAASRHQENKRLLGTFFPIHGTIHTAPSFLYVNKESRDEALKVYKPVIALADDANPLAFASRMYSAGVFCHQEPLPQVWLQAEMDTLFIMDAKGVLESHGSHLFRSDSVTSLAVMEHAWCANWRSRFTDQVTVNHLWNLVKVFPDLKELIIVVEAKGDAMEREAKICMPPSDERHYWAFMERLERLEIERKIEQRTRKREEIRSLFNHQSSIHTPPDSDFNTNPETCDLSDWTKVEFKYRMIKFSGN